MILVRLERYLREHGVAFRRLPHPRAVDAQRTAEAKGISGWVVAKAIAVELASGEEIICVVPAPALVDLDAVCDATRSRDARLVERDRLEELFPGCQEGAIPPFGGFWGMPVVCDPALLEDDVFYVSGGDYRTMLELNTEDYRILEAPILAPIASMPGEPWAHAVSAEAFHEGA